MPIGTMIFRADAGPTIGAGHVMRCLALAQRWKEKGGEAIFVMADSTPFITARLAAENLKLFNLQVGSAPDDAYATAEVALQHSAKWIAVDGYHFGPEYLRALRRSGSKLLRIDDLGRSDCASANLVLNQNFHAKPEMYPDSPGTRFLLGPRYALLRDEFARLPNSREFSAVAQNLLVTAGGGDQSNVLHLMLEALESIPYEMDVRVIGGEGLVALPTLASKSRVQLERDVNDMHALMSWADVAISAAGSTCWELCRTGLPSVIVDIAGNQRPLAQELNSLGILIHIEREHATAEVLAKALLQIIPDRERRREMSERGKNLIDGKGSSRVVSAMRASSVLLRLATGEDSRLLWQWANDPEVRAASFSSQAITWEEHCCWIKRKLEDPGARLWIAEEESSPLGVVRVEVKGESWGEIAVTLAPEKRGEGLAQHLIRDAAEKALDELEVEQVLAFVRTENLSSRKAFEAAGFRYVGYTTVKDCEAIRYEWRRHANEVKEAASIGSVGEL